MQTKAKYIGMVKQNRKCKHLNTSGSLDIFWMSVTIKLGWLKTNNNKHFLFPLQFSLKNVEKCLSWWTVSLVWLTSKVQKNGSQEEVVGVRLGKKIFCGAWRKANLCTEKKKSPNQIQYKVVDKWWEKKKKS